MSLETRRASLWIVDDKQDRRHAFLEAAKKAGFGASSKASVSAGSNVPPECSVILGHNPNLLKSFIREARLPTFHYRGEHFELPTDAHECEYALPFPVDPDVQADVLMPFMQELFHYATSPHPTRLPACLREATLPVALSILCQGYLAVVGAARNDNEVSKAIAKLGEEGRRCLEEAVAHWNEIENVEKWFRPGISEIRDSITKWGGREEAYWRSLTNARPELKGCADTVRRLYSALVKGRQANWTKLVGNAYRAYAKVFL